MTVCKTFSRKPLVKGQNYRKADVICNLEGQERMASTYYDPPRDELRTFFDENDKEWVNDYDAAHVLHFWRRTLKTPGEIPAWERTKIRHVFLRRKGQKSGVYEYLGTAIDETRITGKNSREERQFYIQ
ncbi:MAG: hypothetical protein LBQ57_05920 [Spirochaetales bacterium]|jgi:hypothetical protein|nr:hypothetical protein [Spirochaetales bacterium]